MTLYLIPTAGQLKSDYISVAYWIYVDAIFVKCDKYSMKYSILNQHQDPIYLCTPPISRNRYFEDDFSGNKLSVIRGGWGYNFIINGNILIKMGVVSTSYRI